MDKIEDFLSRYHHCDNGCIEVYTNINGSGYGRIIMNGKQILAHRHSYKIANGEIPEGMFVLHDCDNKLCINPKHLHLGTAKDNSREARERVQFKKRTMPEIEVVEQIIQMLACTDISGRKIADLFGIDPDCVSKITVGRNYPSVLPHVPRPIVRPKWHPKKKRI